ncbi:unnamed protein product [Mytilus coruscus]|uniref:Uncharacterized protein n=1 Tax=Mytilus coruscus TaxID=42192 RepID=A0A6J8EJK3_MYTCO|nr:unnamed protein product [Mytilus coruscus]
MALQSLKQNKEIVIKRADKNSSTVILDKKNYVEQALAQLNDGIHYEQIAISHSTEIYHLIESQEIKELRQDHDELQRGVEAMELNVQSLEVEKLESMRQSFETKLTNLQEQQLLLEKHDRKYNFLVYGMPEKSDENIWAVLDNLMINYLKIDKPKVDSFPLANAHRILARQNIGERKRPNPIIIRFMHYADKQFFLSHGPNLAGKSIRMVDDLPPCMKEARNELTKIGYKIRSEEKLKTRIRHSGVTVILETRNSSRDQWQVRKEFRCC